jgi:hypothetical protein
VDYHDLFLSFQNANRLSASAQLGNKARAASLANLETRQRELVQLRQLKIAIEFLRGLSINHGMHR